MNDSGPRYALSTEWLLDAPAEPIFDALAEPEVWPRWWPYAESVVLVARGDAQGLRSVYRYVWSTRLPYRLSFEMTTTASRRPTLLEGTARGQLSGIGRWRIVRDGEASCVRYDWIVSTGKRWMRTLAPMLRPLFEWNHDQVMAAGGRGLARHLGVPLLAYRRRRPDEDNRSVGARKGQR